MPLVFTPDLFALALSRKRLPALATALGLFFTLAAPGLCLAEDNPLDSLVLAQRGVDERNSDHFNRAVDVPSVVDKAFDALLAVLRSRAAANEPPNGGPALLLTMLATANDNTAALLKPLLLSEVRGFINTGINGGYFAGQPEGGVRPAAGSLASALEKMPPGRRQILPGRVLSRQGDTASVSAEFIDPGAGRLPLLLDMRRENGLWRVKEISNARSLFEEAARHER